MKLILKKLRNLSAVLLPTVVVGLLPLMAAPVISSTDTNTPSQSVFDLPDNPKEGRDPFFPNSKRPYMDRPNPNGTSDVTSLKLGGISRHGNIILAVINGETFAPGDDADVKTDTGKIHIRCIQIKASSVLVASGDTIVTLTLSNP
jgi:hypothetical protein